MSRSFEVALQRPFYAAHADAYDELITDPVEPWVAAVDRNITVIGRSRARILDAGCGTGRHARRLIDRGHRVTLVDASPDLLDIARRRCPESTAYAADLCDLDLPEKVDAVACRGVLNDLVTDIERDAVCASFSRCLTDGGLLILDLREHHASRERADGTERKVSVDLPDGGTLTFRSRPTWSDNCIQVAEHYELSRGGETTTTSYAFVMRPWSRQEVEQRLTAAGFTGVRIGPGVGRATPDRLLVTATKASPRSHTSAADPDLTRRA